jgi:DNA-binding NtrC family response regulator
MNNINYNVVIYEDNPIWEKTLTLWCKHYGFNKVDSFQCATKCLSYVKEDYLNIDIALIDFYNQDGTTEFLIKQIRELNDNILIIAVSADFVTDSKVIDTEEMVKAIWAGANRVTFKDISYIQEIIEDHLKIRQRDDYQEIKTDPNLLNKNV